MEPTTDIINAYKQAALKMHGKGREEKNKMKEKKEARLKLKKKLTARDKRNGL